MNTNTIIKKKICLIGSFGVGKTSLVRRFVYDQFDDKYLSTIGVKVTKKIMPPVEIDKKKIIQLEFLMWDIEGFEKNMPVTDEYYMGSSGAIAVGDITRPDTVEQLREIIAGYLKIAPGSRIVLVGNKIDLKNESFKLKDSFLKYADQENMKLFFTSAKTGENVEKVFTSLGQLIVKSV